MGSALSEEVVEEQAQVLENQKEYLVRIWDEKGKQKL
jgi:hypothetical protein